MGGDFVQRMLDIEAEKYPNRLAEIWAREEAQRRAAELAKIEEARADAKAVWSLADFYLPVDTVEFLARHDLKESGSEMWRAAFVAGWRAALKR